jgi:hypothetical protein
VLLAFINPSGPTREPQEVSVLVSDTFSFFAAEHTMETTQPGWGRRLRATFSVGAVRFQA